MIKMKSQSKKPSITGNHFIVHEAWRMTHSGWGKGRRCATVIYVVWSLVEFGSRDHYAAEGDSFSVPLPPCKRVVLKPPRSSLKHFLAHGHLTAHAQTTHALTHTHTRRHTKYHYYGNDKDLNMQKASYGCCHPSKKIFVANPFFLLSLRGHCECLIKMSNWSNYSTCWNTIQLRPA